MNDIMLVNAIANICYPFISLIAWYLVHRHNRRRDQEIKIILESNGHRMNSRLDELLAAKERLALEEGRKIGFAEGILAAQKGAI